MCTQYMEAEAITEAVVVAHSVSGVWLQLLLGQVPERISRVCFLNAIVLKTGESFISNAVGPAQVTFSNRAASLPVCICKLIGRNVLFWVAFCRALQGE